MHLEYGEPYNPELFIPGTCAAGQYGLTAAGPCSNTANGNYRRILYIANPAKAQYYAGLTAFGDGANANYNGLLISLQHRFSQNFTVLANDTWAHCLSESEVALNGAGSGQDSFNRHAEYGNCLSGREQVFNISAVIRSPKFSAPWLNRLAGGWQESTIFTAMTGSYSTVVVGTDNSRTGNGADRPNIVDSAAVSNQTLSHWFNTAAFQVGPVGTFGNAGRDTILGPGAWNFDVAVSRLFSIRERQRVELRAEAFNLANHARFGNPGTTINTPSFGVITTALDPRIMQFALKYVF